MENNEEEKIKKRLENAEFNNPTEDMEINEEEKEISSIEKKDKKKNIIIIGLAILVLILILIIILFVVNGGKKEDSVNSDTKEEQGDTTKPDNKDESSTVKEEDFDFAKAKVYFNKYIVLLSNDNRKRVITDLDLNVIYDCKSYCKVYQADNKSLYVVNISDTPTLVTLIKDNKATEVIKETTSGILLDNETFMGLYKIDNNKETVYLVNGSSYDTLNLNYNISYFYNTSNTEDKFIYNKRYLITFDSNSKKFGVYDVKNKKQIIDCTYDQIQHLYDDKFEAYKNGFAGIINKDNTELVSFDQDIIVYNNGLYFLGKNNELHIYDSKFNYLNSYVIVPEVDDYTYGLCCGNYNPFDLYKFHDYVILRVGNDIDQLSDYYAISKTGDVTVLGKGNIGFVGNYLVKSSNSDTNILMYDSSLTVKHTIDVKEKAIRLNNLGLYLTNTLVINNNNLYDLTKDTSKGGTSWYRRTSQEYEVRIDFKGDSGTVTVSVDGEVLKKLDNVSVIEFLNTDNNGITVTKDYFIYNAGGVIVLKREEPKTDSMLDSLGLF